MPNATSQREFAVRARAEGTHHPRRILERSFEAAAIAYAEDLPHDSQSASRVAVVVRDTATGAEHCFHIDLDSGDADACG